MTTAAELVRDVAVLYVDPRGPYPQLVEHWYDETRDARTYAGPWPVVAHPPCGPWGRLRHLSRKDDPSHAVHAVGIVRQFGGVLEHPRQSTLLEYCGIPRPGELPDRFGGVTIEVSQCNWGHVARKRRAERGRAMTPRKSKLQKAIETLRNPGGGTTLVSHGFVKREVIETPEAAYARGRADGEADAVRAIVAWLRARVQVCETDFGYRTSAVEATNRAAEAIERGDWRVK